MVSRKNSNERPYKAITVLGILAPFVCMVMLGKNEYRSTFTTEKWLDSVQGKVYMVDDLLNDYSLNGMTKAEVISLLGAPSETEYFKRNNNMVYYLGNERIHSRIDSEWLVINLTIMREFIPIRFLQTNGSKNQSL